MEQSHDAFQPPTGWSEREPGAQTEPAGVRVMIVKERVSKGPAKPKIHRCEICLSVGNDTAFSRKPDLTRHVVVVHNKKKPYPCTWKGCGTWFSSTSALKNHRSVHTHEKLWKCPICSLRFSEQSSCGRHQKEKHRGLTHFCPFCDKTVIRTNDFARHLQSCHNVKKSAEERSLYKLHHSTPLEIMATMPQFTLPGMNGLEMRRKVLDAQESASPRTRVKHAVDVSIQESELISLSPGPPIMSGYETTPSSTTGFSVSPSPSYTDISDDGYASQSGYNNALEIDFGSGGQMLYANMQPISRTSSTTSLLSDGRLQVPSRASSASSFSTGGYAYGFTASLAPSEEMSFVFTPDTQVTGGSSSYARAAGGQMHYDVQTTNGSYVYNPQAAFGVGGVSTQNQTRYYYIARQPEEVTSISHTRRGMAHLSAQQWGSQGSLN
ncbi:hypothetical protein BD311DRAFT_477540 [Dichomitus squalens]|uniref:C2H2-type domain-containing protein n=1 Tax=Dichomitus squalens TaxID=114155 RepID=A0A4Q9MYG6_9APHY|nr:hypothetical protein BD311DRAFT_477540 [Dichomitus squalens]